MCDIIDIFYIRGRIYNVYTYLSCILYISRPKPTPNL